MTRRYAKRMLPADRQNQLLDVALELIAESGYGGLSVQAVADRADVTRPVLYEQFSNLDELLVALLAREEGRMQRAVAATLPPTPPPAGADPGEVLAAAMHGFLQAVHDAPGTWRLIYQPDEGTPESLRRNLEHARRRIRGQLVEVIGWALREHGVADQVDVELLAHIAQTFIARAAILVLTEPESFPPERLTRFVTDLYATVGSR